MIYKLSFNHTGNRATLKDFFWVFGNSLPSVLWFFVSTIWSPLTLEGHIWLISSSFSTIQLSVGAQILGLQFLFGHEIQRSTLQKFADLWDTKSSVTGLATLLGYNVLNFFFVLLATYKLNRRFYYLMDLPTWQQKGKKIWNCHI
jgi:hypothetical protein